MSARTELRGFRLISLATASLSLALLAACGGADAPESLGRVEQRVSSGVVISAFYGGGGNTGALYQNDFVELFNRGASDVSLSGWSLQYASAVGSTWNVANLDTVTLGAGQHFLVQLAGGSAGAGSALPVTPDQTAPGLDLAAKAGKLALVNSTTQLTCGTGCPSDASVIDFVGFGTANDFEAAAAPATDVTTVGVRAGGGCTDTDDNSSDFVATATPDLGDATSAATPCGAGPVDSGKTDTGGADSAVSDSGTTDAAKGDAASKGPDLSPAGTCSSAVGRAPRGGSAVFSTGLALALGLVGLRARRRR